MDRGTQVNGIWGDPKPVKQIKGATKARNDLKWKAIRDDVETIYMCEDQTLPTTRKIIEEQHGFKASERNWKTKLDEWGFGKYVASKAKSFLIQKSEKRKREEGKETEFFHRNKLIPRESYKRQKQKSEDESLEESNVASTPKFITYGTPKPQDDIRDADEMESGVQVKPSRDIIHHSARASSQLSTIEEVGVTKDRESPIMWKSYHNSNKNSASSTLNINEAAVPSLLKTMSISDDSSTYLVAQSRAGTEPTNIETVVQCDPIHSPGFNLEFFSNEELCERSEQQLITHLIEISKWKATSFVRFTDVASYLLKMDMAVSRFTRSLDRESWTTAQELDKYIEVLAISKDICGPNNSTTLHLKCRYAFLLICNGEHHEAEDVYSELIKEIDQNEKDNVPILFLRFCCQVALYSMLMRRNDIDGYIKLAECLPAYFTSKHCLIQDQAGLQDIYFPLYHSTGWHRTMRLFRITEGLLGSAFKSLYVGKSMFILQILEGVNLLYDQGYSANDETLESFYEEVLKQVSADEFGTRRDKIGLEYTKHYNKQRTHQMREWPAPKIDNWQTLRTASGREEAENLRNDVEDDFFTDKDDGNDNKSKYGTTYTESTITGISYSKYMVPWFQ